MCCCGVLCFLLALKFCSGIVMALLLVVQALTFVMWSRRCAGTGICAVLALICS